MPDGDKGNPNVFTTFQGRYTVDVTEGANYGSDAVMLSCINDVIFLADCTSDADGVLMTLPGECRPDRELRFLALAGSTVEMLTLMPSGVIYGRPSTTYSLNGVSFNISGNFYR